MLYLFTLIRHRQNMLSNYSLKILSKNDVERFCLKMLSNQVCLKMLSNSASTKFDRKLCRNVSNYVEYCRNMSNNVVKKMMSNNDVE